MANWAISSVQRDGTVKNVLVMDDHSRMATSTKIPYMVNRPSRRLKPSTTRM